MLLLLMMFVGDLVVVVHRLSTKTHTTHSVVNPILKHPLMNSTNIDEEIILFRIHLINIQMDLEMKIECWKILARMVILYKEVLFLRSLVCYRMKRNFGIWVDNCKFSFRERIQGLFTVNFDSFEGKI